MREPATDRGGDGGGGGGGRWCGGGGDEGRIALLSLGFALVAAVLVLVVVSASAVHLQRKRLYALADSAAAAAAGALDEGAYFTTGLDAGAVPLSDASVREAAQEYVRGAGAGEVAGLRVAAGTGSPDGRTAVVVLSAVVVPPFAGLVPERFAGGVQLRASSRATARLEGFGAAAG
ncbi:pilus assembly protein TadG-related protein [Kineococcus arenarius]|uniref:pilus assembly protein TadG-related protein n=1 Tax=Kineococcus sp. SYSU DK007 TaxID=3383128 RepID=UPI003D7C8155